MAKKRLFHLRKIRVEIIFRFIDNRFSDGA